MKEFDLDKLERKTPYKVPENFFEEMQANVLKNTTNKEKKETKVFRLHFSAVTSIAAALALIFGFTFLWKTNQADITTPTNTDSMVIVKTPTKECNIFKHQDLTTVSEVHQVAKEIQKQADIVSNTTTNTGTTSNIKMPAKTADLNYDKKKKKKKDEELKELNKNSDLDIYLALFN